MVEEFEKYVNNYDLTKEKIILKKNHSIRVMNLCVKYAKKLGFNDEDVSLAKVIGLLHDIGRFEQLKQYDSFEDEKTIDHASLGVNILFCDGLIEKFWNKKEDYELIEFAIKNHNKMKIEETTNERFLKFAKLIRDIDKIDIIYLLGYLSELDTEPSNDLINPKIINSIKNYELSSYKDIKNINDSIALKFAYTYDINYDECLEEFKQNLYYFYKQINFDERFKEIFETVNKYIDERIDKYVRN